MGGTASIFETESGRRWLETEVLPGYLQRSRWFGAKSRGAFEVTLVEMIQFSGAGCLGLVKVDYGTGDPDLYQLPMLSAQRHEVEGLLAVFPQALIAEVQAMVLVDGLVDPKFRAELWQRITGSNEPAPESRMLGLEQSNSSLLYGELVFVKVFRRIQSGINPDAEILKFLTEERKFPYVPAFKGGLEGNVGSSGVALLALAIEAVRNQGDAWRFTTGRLKTFYARAEGADPSDPEQVRMLIGEEFLSRMAQLGERTGQLHLALAGPTTNPDFDPEILTAKDLAELADNLMDLWKQTRSALPADSFNGEAPTEQIERRAGELRERPILATKTRTHGDYHLGQVLETGGDFVLIDFEGEPARSIEARRRKQSPIRDVAGMLRSLHYAAHAARLEHSPSAQLWAEAWTELCSHTFLQAWSQTTNGASFRPASNQDFDLLLNAFLLEKVIYEISYELNNRPAWLPIPLRGLARVLEG